MTRTVPLDILSSLSVSGHHVKINTSDILSRPDTSLGAVYSAEWIGTDATSLPPIVCKVVPRNTNPELISDREKRAYERITPYQAGNTLNVAHIHFHYRTDTHDYFVLTRYGETAWQILESVQDPTARGDLIARLFVSAYIGLSQLRVMEVALRDVHPDNFVSREYPPADAPQAEARQQLDDIYDFVAIDFGHSDAGLPGTDRTFPAMGIVGHPDFLEKRRRPHAGYVDDLFSLAMTVYILLASDRSTPWVTTDAEGEKYRLRYRKEDHSLFTDLADKAKPNLKFQPDFGSLLHGASPDLLEVVKELLNADRTTLERQTFQLKQLRALVAKLDEKVEDVFDTPLMRGWNDIAHDSPPVRIAPPRGETSAAPNTATEGSPPPPEHRSNPTTAMPVAGPPHEIVGLAELTDFRFQPPHFLALTPPAREKPVIVPTRRRESIGQNVVAASRVVALEVLPFLCALVVMPTAAFLAIPSMYSGMSRREISAMGLTATHLLWTLSATLTLLYVIMLRSDKGRASSVRSAILIGLGRGAVGPFALLLIPLTITAALEYVFYLFPVLSWQVDDWQAPQATLATVIWAAVIVVFISFALPKWGRRLRIGAAIALAMAGIGVPSVYLSPWLDHKLNAQQLIVAECGEQTATLTVPSSSLCVPVGADWNQMPEEEYSEDPFVSSLALPATSTTIVGPGETAVALRSSRFTCLTVYAVSRGADPRPLSLPDDVTVGNSALHTVEPEGADGRTHRVRLGDTSYVVYDNVTTTPDSRMGTTAYVPGGLKNTHVAVYAVERGCAVSDASAVKDESHNLIDSMGIIARDRLDKMSIQYDDVALLELGLAANDIQIPLPENTLPSAWSSSVFTEADDSLLATGVVVLSSQPDAPYVGIRFSDREPSGMDTATAELSPVSGWTAKAPTSTLDEATGVTQTTHRFYVKQVIHDADFFVEATVVITDPEKYNAAVKNRLSEMLQGTWLSAPAPTD